MLRTRAILTGGALITYVPVSGLLGAWAYPGFYNGGGSRGGTGPGGPGTEVPQWGPGAKSRYGVWGTKSPRN